MPYVSDKQRAFLHAEHPVIAKRWDKETGGKIKAADMDMGKKKKMPALAISFGMHAPDDTDNPDAPEGEGAVDDKGADDTEATAQAAGDAALEALKASDGLSFMKAIKAGMAALNGSDSEGDMQAADMDMGDKDEPMNPWGG